MGPPSGAGTCGTAAATYVPTSPHSRIEILIACFMGFLLGRIQLIKITFADAVTNYKPHVKPLPAITLGLFLLS
jgi:hypothetical protein